MSDNNPPDDEKIMACAIYSEDEEKFINCIENNNEINVDYDNTPFEDRKIKIPSGVELTNQESDNEEIDSFVVKYDDDNLFVKKIQEYLKNIDWDDISGSDKDFWEVVYILGRNQKEKSILLDPYCECSEKNPLYKHEQWLRRVFADEELRMTDRLLAKICGTGHTKIGYWRRQFNIPAKEPKGYYISSDGYKQLNMPKEYSHPEVKIYKDHSGQIRPEHIVRLEQYLTKHLNSGLTSAMKNFGISEDCLFKDKIGDKDYLYIKKKCAIHHINFKNLDNRLENLYLYKSNVKHKEGEATLYECFRDLVKLNQIVFVDGEYFFNKNLDCRNLTNLEIKKLIAPIEHIYKNSREYISSRGYLYVGTPENYGNPYAAKHKGFMLLHRYNMEKYLARHPSLKISKKCLINGKYLDSKYHVHHINFDPLDNRLKNLWVSDISGHSSVQKSLFSLVDSLLNSGFISFKNGKYFLDFL